MARRSDRRRRAGRERPAAPLPRPEESATVDPALGANLATKANITQAIYNLMQLSGGAGDRLYFFFSGHGLTSRISNRDERDPRDRTSRR